MDAEVVITSAAGAIILFLLSLITFFMKKQYAKQDQTSDDVTEIKLILQKDSAALSKHKNTCEWKHKGLDEKLKDHDERITKAEKDIIDLKTT